jgi:hypothetical protein
MAEMKYDSRIMLLCRWGASHPCCRTCGRIGSGSLCCMESAPCWSCHWERCREWDVCSELDDSSATWLVSPRCKLSLWVVWIDQSPIYDKFWPNFCLCCSLMSTPHHCIDSPMLYMREFNSKTSSFWEDFSNQLQWISYIWIASHCGEETPDRRPFAVGTSQDLLFMGEASHAIAYPFTVFLLFSILYLTSVI